MEDDFLTISRAAAGTAVAFALHLVARLCAQEQTDQVRTAIVAP